MFHNRSVFVITEASFHFHLLAILFDIIPILSKWVSKSFCGRWIQMWQQNFKIEIGESYMVDRKFKNCFTFMNMSDLSFLGVLKPENRTS